jgi:hypothetical protein
MSEEDRELSRYDEEKAWLRAVINGQAGDAPRQQRKNK